MQYWGGIFRNRTLLRVPTSSLCFLVERSLLKYVTPVNAGISGSHLGL